MTGRLKPAVVNLDGRLQEMLKICSDFHDCDEKATGRLLAAWRAPGRIEVAVERLSFVADQATAQDGGRQIGQLQQELTTTAALVFSAGPKAKLKELPDAAGGMAGMFKKFVDGRVAAEVLEPSGKLTHMAEALRLEAAEFLHPVRTG